MRALWLPRSASNTPLTTKTKACEDRGGHSPDPNQPFLGLRVWGRAQGPFPRASRRPSAPPAGAPRLPPPLSLPRHGAWPSSRGGGRAASRRWVHGEAPVGLGGPPRALRHPGPTAPASLGSSSRLRVQPGWGAPRQGPQRGLRGLEGMGPVHGYGVMLGVFFPFFLEKGGSDTFLEMSVRG